MVATFGALLGAPTLRLRGDYLAIVTLGFGEIVPLFFKNLSSVTFSLNVGPINIQLENANWTGGVQGINPIDPPFLPFFDIIFGARSGPLAAVPRAVPAADRDRRRPQPGTLAHRPGLGRIREDETAAEMMGVNTVRTKLLAFALGASFAGVAGVFQASYLGASTSDFFDFTISILVLIMVILGGIGNFWGAVLGAFALTYVDKTFLPYLGPAISATVATRGARTPAEYNYLLFGVILVLMMRYRPQGFCPSRQREAELSVGGLAGPRWPWAMPVELDNVGVAPPGQDETAPTRGRRTRGEARDLDRTT